MHVFGMEKKDRSAVSANFRFSTERTDCCVAAYMVHSNLQRRRKKRERVSILSSPEQLKSMQEG